MAGHRVLIVGRGQGADICLRDASVSRLHAELVVGGDGQFHVADRSSANGTWVEVDGVWERLTQRRVAAGDRLRFGSRRVVVSELMRRVDVGTGPPHVTPRSHARDNGAADAPARLAVRRDSVTGAVVKG